MITEDDVIPIATSQRVDAKAADHDVSATARCNNVVVAISGVGAFNQDRDWLGRPCIWHRKARTPVVTKEDIGRIDRTTGRGGDQVVACATFDGVGPQTAQT